MMREVQAVSLAPQAADPRPGTAPFRSTRREPRSSAELTFAVCGLTVSGRFFVELCSTVNISRSGCCLRLRTRPQTDSALALRAVPGGTSLPEGTSQLLFQLAWLRPDADGWLIGASALGEADLCRLAFPSYTP
jgi:PilZ domain